MNLLWPALQSKWFFVGVELISASLSSKLNGKQPVAGLLLFPQESNLLASAQNHPCDERRERTGEQGEGGGRGRGGEEEEKGKEEEEEEERATDVSGDVQRSQRTSGSLHAAAHTNHPGWLQIYLAPIFSSLIIPSAS